MFQKKVQQYIVKEKMFAGGEHLLVALSGGADSVALLRVLLSLGYTCEAAHCNFHLRGEESDRDENFVRALCDKHQVPLHVVHFATTDYARQHHLSIEMAARELRYAYFQSLLSERGFSCIAVAHHQNDSVETFLLNLIRGTGINGLKGIRPKNGNIVRPLLSVSRKEILAYLDSLQQAYVVDSTNLQDEYTRNKIRLNILPLMEEINPSVQHSIMETAGRLSEVAELYNQLMEQGKANVVSAFPEGGEDAIQISIPKLLEESASQSLLFEILHPLGFNSAQIEQLFGMLMGNSGKRLMGKEWIVIKDRSFLLIVRAKNFAQLGIRGAKLSSKEKNASESFSVSSCSTDAQTKEMSTTLEQFELPEHGTFSLGPHEELLVQSLLRTSTFEIPKQKYIACVDADKLTFPLTIRRWRQGDKFVPFGMQGMKMLSDYMTDRKFSLLQKQQQWVVCSGDKIVWLVGERSDNRFRIEENTTRVLLLEVRAK